MKATNVTDTQQKKTTGRILIVDDLPNWRETLTDLLVADGHTVYAVAKPSHALRLIAQRSVDVVILDLRLEDRDIYNVRGVQLLQEIRSKSPRTCVLMMTGFPSNGLLEKIPHIYDVDSFWLKNPVGSHFDIDMFRQEIQGLVAKSRQHK